MQFLDRHSDAIDTCLPFHEHMIYIIYVYLYTVHSSAASGDMSESLPSSYQNSAASIKLPCASNLTQWWECLDQSTWLLSSAAVSRSACFLLPWSTSTWPSQPPCHLFLTASIPWIYCIHSKIQQAVGKWIKCRNQMSTYFFNAALMQEVQIFVKLEKIQSQDKSFWNNMKKYNVYNNESQRTLRPQQLHRLKLPDANEIWNMPKDSVFETSWAPLHVRCLHNVQPSSGILCKHDRWFRIMLIPKTGCDSATFGLAKRNMQGAETKQLRSCLSSWPKSNSSKWNNTVYRWIVNAIGIAIVYILLQSIDLMNRLTQELQRKVWLEKYIDVYCMSSSTAFWPKQVCFWPMHFQLRRVFELLTDK